MIHIRFLISTILITIILIMSVGIGAANEVTLTLESITTDAFPNNAMDVCVTGNHAYVADYTNGLVIVDISDPANPTTVGHFPSRIGNFGYTAAAIGVAVSGNYAYVANWYDDLYIIDVTDKTNPTLANTYTIDDGADSITISGDLAFIAAEWAGVDIIDISDPINPVFIGNYNTDDLAEDVAIQNNYAYIADRDDGVIIVDISDLANPSFVSSCDTPYDANSIVVSGAYAYVADADDTLIIDISNPTAPAIVGQYDTGDAWGIALDGNYVYVGDGDNGVVVLNVNDPANPVYAGSYDTAGYAGGLNIVSNLVYVADDSLVILRTDASSTSGPVHNINKGTHYTTIQAAIDDASPGDEIHVDSGTYYENVIVNKQLTLRGIDTGTGMPVVNAGGSGNVVTISADGCILNSFIITNSGLLDVNAGIIITSNDNIIKNNEVSSNKAGISLESSNNNAIEGNIVNFNSYPGIALTSSNDNIISHNEVNSNAYYGIELYLSSNNTVIGNIANSNTRYGIFVWKSDTDNRLISNTANTNDYAGIRFHTSSNNEVSGNLLVSNIEYGISMYGSNGNIISENNASFSKNGIYLDSSSNNMIYHNNIIKNTNQAFDNLGPNTWDNGYPSGGNYWSDYIEVDIKSGPNQDQSGSDGIGDTSYPIPGGSIVDRYPLMAPYSPTPPPLGFTVGQGAPTPEIEQLFIDAYNRNGGVGVLGDPATEVHDAWGYLVQDFPGANGYAGGIIMYNPNENSAYYIHGKIWDRYYSLGGPIAKTDIEFQLGLPINDVLPYMHSEPPLISSHGSQYRYQNFAGETEMAALEYNLATDMVYEIHGAIYATWSAMGYADSILGLVTSDERDAVPSFKGTTGRVSDFENGHLHWHSSGDHYMVTYMTYGDLDELYVSMGGTASWLGFPVMHQEDRGGYGYCEFEGGYIEWDAASGKYVAKKSEITDGLVAEWHFDEGTGNVLGDSSGNGNDGTIYGATWTTNGKFDSALQFDGNDYIVIPDSPELSGGAGKNLTVEYWFNTNNQGAYIISKIRDVSYKDWSALIGGFGPGLNFWYENRGYDRRFYSGSTIEEGIWHHGAFTFQRSTSGSNAVLKMYLDGNELPLTPFYQDGVPSNQLYDMPDTSAPVSIGYAGTYYGNLYFNGKIDEIRVFDRVLTAEDIKSEFEKGGANEKPICRIELRKHETASESNEFEAGELFDIYVGDSTDDTGIKYVRFSGDNLEYSDSNKKWTEWNDWLISSRDWDTDNKNTNWAFATSGDKVIWAEIKDGEDKTSLCSANLFVNQPPLGIIRHYPSSVGIFLDMPYTFYSSNYDTNQEITFEYSGNPDSAMHQWDFGDGTGMSTLEDNVKHSYSKSGIYTVTLSSVDTPLQIYTSIEIFVSDPLQQSIEKLKEQISSYSNTNTMYLDNVLGQTKIAANAADEFNEDRSDARIEALIDVCFIAMKVQSANDVSLFKEIWVSVLKKSEQEFSKIIAEKTFHEFDQLFFVQYTYFDFIEKGDNSIKNQIDEKINIIKSSKDNTIDKVDALDLTQDEVELYTRDLSRRRLANHLMNNFYTDQTNLLDEFSNIKKEDENDWKLKLAKFSWSVGGIASYIAYWPSGVFFSENMLIEDLKKITLSDKMFLLSHLAVEKSGTLQSQDFSQNLIEGISQNTIQGFQNINERTSPIIIEGKINSVEENGNIHYVTIENTGKENAEYRLIANFEEVYTTYELFAIGTAKIGRYYKLPTTALYPIDKSWMMVEPGKQSIIGIEIPEDSTRLSLNLLGQSKTGIYGVDTWSWTKEGWFQSVGSWISGILHSPVELNIIDSQGRVTGILNGEIKEEIPNSMYDNTNEKFTIFSPSSSPHEFSTHNYLVKGTDEGTYGLEITAFIKGKETSFIAKDIPTNLRHLHKYTINWDAIHNNENGVTVLIDSDGDGVFERTIETDNTFNLFDFNIYNITFLPPITTMDQFNLTDGSTLPIKFTVRDRITNEFIYDDTVNVTITNSTGHSITYFTNGTGTGSVRINSEEEQYIANFHTKDYAINIGETYSVTVTFGEPDSLRGYDITYFTLIEGGKAKGKGN